MPIHRFHSDRSNRLRRPPGDGVNTKAPVIERFGLAGFGAHSNDAEYILIGSIEPRLYLAAPLIMDMAQGAAR